MLIAPVSLLHLQSESKMFDVKTVFVVGAGGSKEVGLSIGDGLRDRIGDKLRIGTDRMGNIRSGDDDILDALRYLNRDSDGRVPRQYRQEERSVGKDGISE